MRKGLRFWLPVGTALTASAWKAVLITTGAVPFNADEAVVGLMARHILAGARPVFFYGQAYMGSLDAYLVAAGIAVFGEQVWVIRVVQALLYLGFLWAAGAVGREIGGERTGWWTAALLAIPPVNLSLYTTASLGGYGEALLVGSLALLAALRYRRSPRWETVLWLGFLTGLGLWVNALSWMMALPALAYVFTGPLRAGNRRATLTLLAAALSGGLAGAVPWGFYAVQNGPARLIAEITGSAVAVESAGFIARIVSHAVHFILLGLTAAVGLRPPWDVIWLGLPLLPLALAFWSWVLVFLFRQTFGMGERVQGMDLMGWTFATFTAAFVFTSFGVDPSGRYFTVLNLPLAVGAAVLLERLPWRPVVRGAVLGAMLIFQVWGNLQCVLTNPPGLTTQFDRNARIDTRAFPELLAFLRAENETRGFSTYWVTYPLAFLSQEELLFSPRLPYHPDLRYTERDIRIPHYDQAAREAGRSAYITALNPALDEIVRTELTRLGVSWQEKQIGDFQVFYRLSRRVLPEEMGLGITFAGEKTP